MSTRVIMHPPPNASGEGAPPPASATPGDAQPGPTPGRPGYVRRTLEHQGAGVRTRVIVDEPVQLEKAESDELAQRIAEVKADHALEVQRRRDAEAKEAAAKDAAAKAPPGETARERAARLRVELEAAEADAAGEQRST